MRIAIDARKIGDFGIGTYIRGLLRGLNEIGGNEQYVVLAPRGAEGIPERFEHVAADAPHYSLRELLSVGREARRGGADLLHAPHYVVPFTRLPVVVTIHDLIHLHVRPRNPLAPLYARAMLGRAVRKSARIFTVSAAVRDDIVSELGGDPGKIVVTVNGVDDRFRAELPNPAPKRYFLFAGNDKPHKNAERLVEAFGRVRAAMPDLSLILAGGAFERFQSREGVITPGFVTVEELASLYRNALAVVQPSIEEGFGLPAAEAMASGAAVITSKARALVEVTGDAALHADAESVDSIAAAMEKIASNDSLRVTLARRGIERARVLTWKRCAELTRDAYFEVLRR